MIGYGPRRVLSIILKLFTFLRDKVIRSKEYNVSDLNERLTQPTKGARFCKGAGRPSAAS